MRLRYYKNGLTRLDLDRRGLHSLHTRTPAIVPNCIVRLFKNAIKLRPEEDAKSTARTCVMSHTCGRDRHLKTPNADTVSTAGISQLSDQRRIMVFSISRLARVASKSNEDPISFCTHAAPQTSEAAIPPAPALPHSHYRRLLLILQQDPVRFVLIRHPLLFASLRLYSFSSPVFFTKALLHTIAFLTPHRLPPPSAGRVR